MQFKKLTLILSLLLASTVLSAPIKEEETKGIKEAKDSIKPTTIPLNIDKNASQGFGNFKPNEGSFQGFGNNKMPSSRPSMPSNINKNNIQGFGGNMNVNGRIPTGNNMQGFGNFNKNNKGSFQGFRNNNMNGRMPSGRTNFPTNTNRNNNFQGFGNNMQGFGNMNANGRMPTGRTNFPTNTNRNTNFQGFGEKANAKKPITGATTIPIKIDKKEKN